MVLGFRFLVRCVNLLLGLSWSTFLTHPWALVGNHGSQQLQMTLWNLLMLPVLPVRRGLLPPGLWTDLGWDTRTELLLLCSRLVQQRETTQRIGDRNFRSKVRGFEGSSSDLPHRVAAALPPAPNCCCQRPCSHGEERLCHRHPPPWNHRNRKIPLTPAKSACFSDRASQSFRSR